MRIQKVKIDGFKSFAQKAEIQFDGNGLTAILGPNGCGKSNVMDAIRWVMGEQRASQLRMEKMQGVIFSGTQERPAMSRAEVSLVIENDRGLLPPEYTEVVVTRRTFSNGDSEYLINNQECRLADIRNLFAGTGMGANSYSQMDERMVRALLSDKADERRVLFEEAAGISKYKKQKKDAVSRLDGVLADMERVAVILQEAKTRFRQQERMLARATEFRELKKRLKEIDISINIGKYAAGKVSLHELSTIKMKSEAELEALKAKLTELELKITEKGLLIANEEEDYRESERELSLASEEIAKLNEAYKHLQSREKELEEQAVRCEREMNENNAGISALKDEMQNLEQELKSFAPEIEEIKSKEQKENEILQNTKERTENLRIKHRKLSNKRFESVQAEGKLKSLWQKTDTEIDMLEKQISEDKLEVQGFNSQIEEFEKLKEGYETEAAKNKNHSEVLYEKQIVLANEKETLRETESRLEALQNVNESGDLEGNKWILNEHAAEGVALLSGKVETLESKHISLVEFCLGFSAQAVLMQSRSAALECAQNVNNNNLGRALLAWNAAPHEEGFTLNEPDAVAVNSLVKENSESLIKALLSKYFLVNSFARAAELAQTYAGKDLWFCTEDCQAVSALGLAAVGKGQEIIKSQLAETKEKLSEIDSLIKSVAEEKKAADSAAIKANSDASVASASIYAIAKQKGKNEQNISNFEARLQELKNSRNSNAELNTAEQELEQVEQEFERIDGELAEQEQVLKNQEELAETLADSLSEKKSMLEKKESRLNFVKEQIHTLNNALDLRQGELSEINGKHKNCERELDEKALQIEQQHDVLEKKEKLRDVAREKYDLMKGDIEEWRSCVRTINQSLREKEKGTHELELAIQASGSNLERMRERIAQEYEFDLEQESGVQGFNPVNIDERDANIEIRDLQEKIKAIGPINATIAEDFEAERERMLSTEAQYNDLVKTKKSYATVIERLDRAARDRFLDTFRKIQKNFQDVYSSIMPGGEALLTMQNDADADPLEADIEINARPPGKKMRGVMALSGGERALTATSLLFALYMVKPSPYCMLDEVDAPLDDANIGRFVALLRRFSHQTQFVVITHNKITMAGCDMLYGVTQEIVGISKIGSIRLEEVPPEWTA